MEKKIKQNMIRCRKCNTTLESKHRHDWVACSCGNFADGGHSYLRRGGNFVDIEELSTYED